MVTGYNQGDWERLLAEDYSRPPAVSDAANMDDTLYLGELVEPLGFDSIWATEHYGSAYWWNPVRLASEISMLSTRFRRPPSAHRRGTRAISPRESRRRSPPKPPRGWPPRTGSTPPRWVSRRVDVPLLWFLTVTNALQFLDGMDGLATGFGAISGIFFSITALQTGQPFLMFLSAALVGGCLGFLPYNFRPGGARIFLGDGGASFIGFTLAGLAVMGEWAQNDLVGLVTPTLDIAFVGVVRVVTGKVHTLREWLAYTGRDHIHHRFEALGFTRAQSVFLIFSISTILGLSAILLENATPRQAVVVLLQAVCVLVVIAVVESVGRGHPR
jgi:hypothetical protein